MGAGFEDLVLVYCEILAQAGKRSRRRSQLQIAQAALEERLVGKHRKRRCAAPMIAPGQVLHVEVLADQSLGRRGLLDFGDHRRTSSRLLPQGRRKAARLVRKRPPLQLGEGHANPGRGHGTPRGGQNRL